MQMHLQAHTWLLLSFLVMPVLHICADLQSSSPCADLKHRLEESQVVVGVQSLAAVDKNQPYANMLPEPCL